MNLNAHHIVVGGALSRALRSSYELLTEQHIPRHGQCKARKPSEWCLPRRSAYAVSRPRSRSCTPHARTLPRHRKPSGAFPAGRSLGSSGLGWAWGPGPNPGCRKHHTVWCAGGQTEPQALRLCSRHSRRLCAGLSGLEHTAEGCVLGCLGWSTQPKAVCWLGCLGLEHSGPSGGISTAGG